MTTAQELQKRFHACMPLFIALGEDVYKRQDLFCMGSPDGEIDAVFSLVRLGMCP